MCNDQREVVFILEMNDKNCMLECFYKNLSEGLINFKKIVTVLFSSVKLSNICVAVVNNFEKITVMVVSLD